MRALLMAPLEQIKGASMHLSETSMHLSEKSACGAALTIFTARIGIVTGEIAAHEAPFNPLWPSSPKLGRTILETLSGV